MTHVRDLLRYCALSHFTAIFRAFQSILRHYLTRFRFRVSPAFSKRKLILRLPPEPLHIASMTDFTRVEGVADFFPERIVGVLLTSREFPPHFVNDGVASKMPR
jgi:hypothetical protein